MLARIISNDFNGNEFRFKCNEHGQTRTLRDLAKIVTLLEIQGGGLIFFSSYKKIALFECELKNYLGETKLFVENRDADKS